MKPVERVQMGCLTQTRSVGESRGSAGVVRTAAAAVVVVVVAAAAVGGITAAVVAAVVVAGVAIPLVVERVEAAPVVVPVTPDVERVGVEPVVVPVTPAVDATIRPAVEPTEPAWPLVEPVVAKD